MIDQGGFIVFHQQVRNEDVLHPGMPLIGLPGLPRTVDELARAELLDGLAVNPPSELVSVVDFRLGQLEVG